MRPSDELERIRDVHDAVPPPTATQRREARAQLLRAIGTRKEVPRYEVVLDSDLDDRVRQAPHARRPIERSPRGGRRVLIPVVAATLVLFAVGAASQLSLRVAPPRPVIGEGAPDIAEPTRAIPLRIERDIDITGDPQLAAQGVRTTVFAPDRAGPWPLVVLVSGWTPATYPESTAAAIAEQGVVVHVVWSAYAASFERGVPEPNVTPSVVRDVTATAACAVRYARSTAGRHDALPDRLVLAGQGMGAWGAALVALSETEELPRGACGVEGGSTVPTSFVGIVGRYECLVHTGGCPAFGASDEAALVPGNHAANRPHLPITLLAPDHSAEGAPGTDRRFGAVLRRAGHPVDVIVLDSASPGDLVIPGRPANQETIERILRTARA